MMLVALASVALAQEVVLYVGEDPDAVRRVSAVSGKPADALRAQELGRLLGRHPVLLEGRGRVRPCFGTVTEAGAFAADVGQTRGWVAKGATEELARTVQGLFVAAPCVDSLVATGTIAALHGLRAAVSWSPTADRAREALALALSLDPTFDRTAYGLPAEASPALLGTAWLAVDPPPVAGWTLDGSPATGSGAEVRWGPHLVRWDDTGLAAWVEVGGPEVVVVRTDALVGDLAEVLDDPERRERLAWAVGHVVEAPSVWVVTEHTLWQVVPEDRSWTQIAEPLPPPPEVPVRNPARNVPYYLVVGGAAAMLLGGTFALVGDHDADHCEASGESCATAQRRIVGGQIALGVGAASVAVGTGWIVWQETRPGDP